MAVIKKSALELRAKETEIRKALNRWYLTPGIQRELRNKENEAVQMVLDVLERRVRIAKDARPPRRTL